VRVVMEKKRHARLLEMIRAPRPASRFPRGLHRRQQQGNQYADDRNHDEKLNESKTV